ncbi:XAC2610-related protein [Flavobacterium tructae]|uniref:Uncharacterized protein n=1 Tax=Flavobacterium tructae TaxID=1114873 RepID=A0A1S1J7R9_9FLAO|nr:hypothetical protein [Flavobacterium tructae]OHT45840.1 hypothetical protein BHE19_08400 [Flavobacterium tructae]OXB17101.1 hypothetical protein B0A71_17690 [Flavobacterium tructae]
MKTKICIITLIILSILSCRQNDENKNKLSDQKKSAAKTFEQKEKKRLEKRAEIEKQDRIDNLKLDKVLSEALKIAIQNIGKDKFQKKYTVKTDQDYNIKVEMNMDNHFTKNAPHLIIWRYGADKLCIDIYSKNGKKLKKVLSHDEWSMTYRNDTIRDINGDGLKDFVVNWYGSVGCCLKAFSNVYLLRKDNKSFSTDFEFINPTFSPKEKIIRGICYGHPAETEMYKYKWNGEAVDTIEFVSYEKNIKDQKTGKIIISKNRSYNNKKIIERLNSVPNEYQKIEGYDWFTGNLDNN